MAISVAILTISDRCARGEQEDRSGAALRAAVEGRGWAVAAAAIVPDEVPAIEAALRAWVSAGHQVILTTGGTGLTARDVTPEATRAVVTREVPGLAETMRAVSRAATPGALLSRALAGTAGETLIINLPGSPVGAIECLDAIADAIPHAVALLIDPHHAPHPAAAPPAARLAPARGRDYNPPPSTGRPPQ